MKLISRLRPYSFHVLARQTITTIFLLLSIITVQGCGGTDDLPSSSSSSSSSSSTSSSSSSSSSSGIVEVKDLSQVNGRILDIAGQPIEGASIAVYSGGTEPSKSAVSSSDGSFSLKLEAEKDFVLRVTAASFADQVVLVKSPDTGGEITIEAGLIARATPITISDNSTLSHAGDAGAMVTVDKADFIDAAGNPVTDDVELTITPVDVSNPAAVAAFPGSFAGIPEGETDATLIVSLGVVEYEFTSNGQPINLAPNTSAEIIVPIYVPTYPDGSAIKLGDSIPVWSLNESTSIWQQEGEGTVVVSSDSPTGFAFKATVTHFSWWNCDVAPQTAQVEITVLGEAAGDAIISAEAPGLINWRGETASTTLNVGDTTDLLDIPTGIEVCFYADITYDAGGLALTGEVCVTATPGEIFQITLSAATEGPLDIGTNPKGEEEDTVAIHAVIDRLITPVKLFPFTVETSVSYAVTAGQLPEGLRLSTFNNQASIVGVPTKVGSHSVTVTATDKDNFIDKAVIDYEVTALDLTNQLYLTFDPAACGPFIDTTLIYLNIEVWYGDAIIDWGDGTTELLSSFEYGAEHFYDDRRAGSVLITFLNGIDTLKAFESLSDGEGSHSCFTFDVAVFSNATRLSSLSYSGANRITGSLASLPTSLRLLNISDTLLEGNIADIPRSLTDLALVDTGMISGDLTDIPPNLRRLAISTGFRSSSTVGRDTSFYSDPSFELNNVTGNISDIPGSVTNIYLSGNARIFGDISQLKTNEANRITLSSNDMNFEFGSTPTWSPSQKLNLSLNGEDGYLDAGEVDRLLQFLSEKLPNAVGALRPSIGINTPRTPASDSAVSVLKNNGYSVY